MLYSPFRSEIEVLFAFAPDQPESACAVAKALFVAKLSFERGLRSEALLAGCFQSFDCFDCLLEEFLFGTGFPGRPGPGWPGPGSP